MEKVKTAEVSLRDLKRVAKHIIRATKVKSVSIFAAESGNLEYACSKPDAFVFSPEEYYRVSVQTMIIGGMMTTWEQRFGKNNFVIFGFDEYSALMIKILDRYLIISVNKDTPLGQIQELNRRIRILITDISRGNAE
jgi:tricorn protease-like protein